MTEPESIQQVRHAMALLERDDIEGMVALTNSNPEYHNPHDAIEPGVRRGREQFGAAFGTAIEGFDYDRIEVERWAARDDAEALVELTMRGKGRVSGAPFEQIEVQHYVFEEGGLIARFEWSLDWDSAATRVGVDDSWQRST